MYPIYNDPAVNQTQNSPKASVTKTVSFSYSEIAKLIKLMIRLYPNFSNQQIVLKARLLTRSLLLTKMTILKIFTSIWSLWFAWWVKQEFARTCWMNKCSARYLTARLRFWCTKNSLMFFYLGYLRSFMMHPLRWYQPLRKELSLIRQTLWEIQTISKANFSVLISFQTSLNVF